MEERQVIVCWYTPEEKHPPEGEIVIVSMSGKFSNGIIYSHAFAIAEWWDDDGWILTDIEKPLEYTVHAWCDLEPYGAKEAWKKLRGEDE